MYVIKLICLTLLQLAKQAWLLPHSVASGFRHWRRRAAINDMEIERLDRIRNPSKYLESDLKARSAREFIKRFGICFCRSCAWSCDAGIRARARAKMPPQLC